VKAVVCTDYGSPEVLSVIEIEKPLPEKNEVLIRIFASTVTTGDCRIIRFDFAQWFWLPGRFIFGFRNPRKKIPGWELSGEIESVGKGVKHLKAGDKVFGFNKGISFGGTNAEYKCLPANRVVTFDLGILGFNDAAVIPIGGLTALHFLRKAKTSACKKSMARNGIYLTVDWPLLLALWTSVFSQRKVIVGMAPDRMEDLKHLKELVESGKIRPVIDTTYPLEEAVEAYRYVDSGRKRGNVVLKHVDMYT
jgi:NADPH:quinone reductase-like Zn-dependent oxidoreductase